MPHEDLKMSARHLSWPDLPPPPSLLLPLLLWYHLLSLSPFIILASAMVASLLFPKHTRLSIGVLSAWDGLPRYMCASDHLLKYHVLNVSLNTMFKTALLSTSLHLSYPAIVFFSFFSLPKNSSLSNTLYKLLIIFVVYYLFLPDRM